MTEILPIADTRFWAERLHNAQQPGRNLHEAVFHVSLEQWTEIHRVHKRILQNLIKPAAKLLDAGCGYGYLLDIIPDLQDYTGIDLSPDFIALARKLHPGKEFIVGDLKSLPFSDKQFDIAICRSVSGMVIGNLGLETWRCMERELIRVSRCLLLLNYSNPEVCQIIADPSPEINTHNTLTIDDKASLIYRCSNGNVCEIFDINVKPEYQRTGLGTQLIKALHKALPNHSIYAFTRHSNNTAIAFYQKLGFREILLPELYAEGPGVMFISSSNGSNSND